MLHSRDNYCVVQHDEDGGMVTETPCAVSKKQREYAGELVSWWAGKAKRY